MDNQSSGVGTSTTTASSSVAPPAFDNRKLEQMSATLELLASSMVRFESRLNEVDSRTSVQRPPPRPEPDPPSALPSHWFSNPFPTTGQAVIPSQSVIISTPAPPFSRASDALILRPPASSTPTTYPSHRFPTIGHDPPGSRPLWTSAGFQPPPASAAWDLPNNNNRGVGLPRADQTSWDIPGSHFGFEPPNSRTAPTSWDNPVTRQFHADQSRNFKMKAPHFDGTDVANWISRGQTILST